MAPPVNEWRMKMADGMNTGNNMNQGRGLTIREEGLNLLLSGVGLAVRVKNMGRKGDARP